MVGETFGSIRVLREVDPYISQAGHRQRRFECLCECGKVWEAVGSALRRGQTDCGCKRRRTTTHGQAGKGTTTATYRVWAGIIQRCENPKSAAYRHYGGRGITVCERWKSYENFYADMGRRPAGLTIERDDVNGNYEPSNCRWATAHDQSRNKRTNVKVNQEVLVDAADRLGLSNTAISVRLSRGWTRDRAFTTPRWHKSKSGFTAKGESHPMSKLTAMEVNEIRRRLDGGEKGAVLAREFGVSRGMVSNIKLGKAWATS